VHKAGFVSLVGKPNVGKSTLMNVLVGENLSIITSKAQTTRHRIKGIISADDYQIVYSDTPGIIEPKYKMHESMMSFVSQSLDDADVILFITDIYEKHDEGMVIERLRRTSTPILLLINKIDQIKNQEDLDEKIQFWKDAINPKEIIPISALERVGTEKVFDQILELLPEHPAYFDKDTLTDKPERFFVSEIVREKIFLNYRKEVPYSCEVVISGFQEEEKLIRVRVEILVERESQRSIIIGQKGESIKKLGIDSRKDLEAFFGKQFFMQTFVKVEKDWRKSDNSLRRFGYLED
jgi:GTP-binding protein Era